MQKKRYFYSTILSCIVLLFSCLRDERYGAGEMEEWFRYTDALLTPIVSTMRVMELKQPFMEGFCERYGVPLWDDTDVYQESPDAPVFFWVPLYHPSFPDEIRTVWFFKMENGLLDYGPVGRDAEIIRQYGQEGQFDYLSFRVFGRKNLSRKVFSSQAMTRGEDGEYVVVGQECRDAYITIEIDGNSMTKYDGTICKDIKVWMSYVDSSLIDDGQGGPIGGGGGGGSGQDVPVEGGGSSQPNAPKAKGIFEHSNMIKETWEWLESLLNDMDKDPCLGQNLYKEILDALGGEKISIQFTEEGYSKYTPATNTLSLKIKDAYSHVLLHELFHAFQYLKKGDGMYNSLLNCEIEAHLAQYMFLKKKPDYKINWEESYTHDKRLSKIVLIDECLTPKMQRNDILGYCLDGYWDAAINAFRKVRKYSNEKVYKYEEVGDIVENLTLLQELVENCK